MNCFSSILKYTYTVVVVKVWVEGLVSSESLTLQSEFALYVSFGHLSNLVFRFVWSLKNSSRRTEIFRLRN